MISGKDLEYCQNIAVYYLTQYGSKYNVLRGNLSIPMNEGHINLFSILFLDYREKI